MKKLLTTIFVMSAIWSSCYGADVIITVVIPDGNVSEMIDVVKSVASNPNMTGVEAKAYVKTKFQQMLISWVKSYRENNAANAAILLVPSAEGFAQ